VASSRSNPVLNQNNEPVIVYTDKLLVKRGNETLDGLVVLDLTRLLPGGGHHAACQLRRGGGQIESRSGRLRQVASALSGWRGRCVPHGESRKKSVALDLKARAGATHF